MAISWKLHPQYFPVAFKKDLGYTKNEHMFMIGEAYEKTCYPSC